MANIKNEETQKRFNSIIYCVVLIVVFISCFFAIRTMFSYNNKTPVGVVQLMSTPSVTLVLNDKDRVINVVFNNYEGEVLLAKTSLEGKTVEEATTIFTKLCCKAGYINTAEDSVGEPLYVIVANLKNSKVAKLNTRLTAVVNDYFDENGVIAGAIFNPKELSETASTYDLDANKFIMIATAIEMGSFYTHAELVNMSQNKIIKHIKYLAEHLKGLSWNCYNEYLDECEKGIKELRAYLNEVVTPVYAGFSELSIDLRLSITLDELITEIKGLELTEEDENNIIECLNENVKDLKKKMTAINSVVAEEKVRLLDESEADFEEVKSLLKKKIDSNSIVLKQNLDYFKNHKNEIQEKINDYRASLVA